MPFRMDFCGQFTSRKVQSLGFPGGPFAVRCEIPHVEAEEERGIPATLAAQQLPLHPCSCSCVVLWTER